MPVALPVIVLHRSRSLAIARSQSEGPCANMILMIWDPPPVPHLPDPQATRPCNPGLPVVWTSSAPHPPVPTALRMRNFETLVPHDSLTS